MATVAARIDRVEVDRLELEAALALRQAAGTPKRLAHAIGRSASVASRWLSGDSGSLVARTSVLVAHLGRSSLTSPFPLIALWKVVAMRSQLRDKSDAELVARFRELVRLETEKEYRENEATALFALGGSLDDLARAHEEEAAVQEELSALCRELADRKIDPRSHGKGRSR